MIKNINFRQPKFMLPAILYFPLLGAGYFIIDLFHVEVKDKEDTSMKTTEYLNAELPSANVSKDIGSKRQNMRDAFGNISDRTAIGDFSEDADTTTKKKEEFESKYSEEELRLLEEQQKQADEIKRLQELNARLSQSAQKGQQMGSQDYVLPVSDEERERALAMRRNGLMADLDRDLNNARRQGQASVGMAAAVQDSVLASAKAKEEKDTTHAVHEVDEDSESHTVVKKVRDGSERFNTLSENVGGNNLIRAIIDEEIKAVDGSRVRLRLLDDIEIDGVQMRKGSYLYAIMNGFSQQRVRGKVSSVMVGDEIIKINLSLYDSTDGLEGLYVPESQFRETAKDVGSSAMSGNMNLNSGYGGNSVGQWAGQALQNAYQRTTNAISKAIKKNRVRLKYGTQVYLVNSRQEKKR